MAGNYSFPCAVDMALDFRMIYLTAPFAVVIAGKSALMAFTAHRTNTIGIHTKFLVTSLAVFDLILGITYVSVGELENLVVKLGILHPEYLERFILGAWYTSVVGYLAHLGLIAVESYIRIAHPFFYIRASTHRSACIVVLCLWIFGLCYMFIPLLLYTKCYHETCILFHPPLEYYCIAAFVVLVSCVAILVANLKIAFLAFRNKKAVIARRLNASKMARREHFLAAARSIKFFSVMCGIYMICTCPSAVCVGLNIFYPVPNFVYLPAIYLVPVNSVFSFLIWFFMNRHFSLAVKRTFSDAKTCCCKGQLLKLCCRCQ